MTIFLDMDGVLADFVGAAGKIHLFTEADLKPGEDVTLSLGMTPRDFWAPIDALGESFWENLEEYPWTDELIDLAQHWNKDEWCILSAPSHSPSCLAGKMKWLQRKFGWDFRRFIFAPKTQKHRLGISYATPRVERLSGQSYFANTLIDDNDGNCQRFVAAGGSAVVFPQVWNSNAAIVDKKVEYVYNQMY